MAYFCKYCGGLVKYVGLVCINRATGFVQEGYKCQRCGKKWQKPTMFAPEAAKIMPRHPDCIDLEKQFINK